MKRYAQVGGLRERYTEWHFHILLRARRSAVIEERKLK